MKSKVLTRGAIALIIFGVLCGLAAYLAPSRDPQGPAWFCIMPPVLAILPAFLTRQVMVSLGVAILAGGLLVAGLALIFAYLPSSLGLAPGWSFVLAFFIMLCFLAGFVRRGDTHQETQT